MDHYQNHNLLKSCKDLLNQDLNHIFDDIESALAEPISDNFNYEYDRIVSFGEILSTTILYHLSY